MNGSDDDTNFFERVYKARNPEETVELYDQWAASYDNVVAEAGYETPRRIAKILAGHVNDHHEPVLDFGCGTGLSGVALTDAGFSAVDGLDVSEGMLAKARELGVYRQLGASVPGKPPPVAPGEYASVVACGVIGAGAAPLSVLDDLLGILAPGHALIFSFNDHTLQDGESVAYVDRLLQDGVAAQVAYDYGAHLPELGIKSAIYLLEKL